MEKLKILCVRTLYKIAWPFRLSYWFIFQPHTKGVKCLVLNGNNILLIRIAYAPFSYKYRWTLPGGGVHKNEEFSDAAKRETREEVGIDLSNIEQIYEYDNRIQFKRDHVVCFYGRTSSDYFKIDPQEISEARWFSIDALPEYRHDKIDILISKIR